jgi:hypothetical protein
MDQKIRVEVAVTPRKVGEKTGIVGCLLLALLYPVLLTGLTVGVIYLLNTHII